MKNKQSLVLMEQLIMILVFALAAALCLQAFALSDRLSRRSQSRDQAVLVCQNAAEILEHCSGDYALASSQLGGSWDGSVWEITYDEVWTSNTDSPAYILQVTPLESGNPLLGTARVKLHTANGDELFSLSASWQKEVSTDGT